MKDGSYERPLIVEQESSRIASRRMGTEQKQSEISGQVERISAYNHGED